MSLMALDYRFFPVNVSSASDQSKASHMASVPVNELSTERLSALRDLITLRDTPSNCRLRLATYTWDGQPATLTRLDVEYERKYREWLNFVLWSLSDQQLNGPICTEAVLHLLSLDETSVLPQ
jgi:hypothetical protein